TLLHKIHWRINSPRDHHANSCNIRASGERGSSKENPGHSDAEVLPCSVWSTMGRWPNRNVPNGVIGKDYFPGKKRTRWYCFQKGAGAVVGIIFIFPDYVRSSARSKCRVDKHSASAVPAYVWWMRYAYPPYIWFEDRR